MDSAPVQAVQYVDPHSGQQRVVEGEAGIFGGGPDEGQGAVFHVG